MHRILSELISNPNYLSTNEVCDKLSKNELISVFGGSFVENLELNKDKFKILDSGSAIEIPENYEEFTQIFIWGGRKSGKTSLLGTLFAAMKDECKFINWLPKVGPSNRIRNLIDYFSCQDWNFCRIKDCSDKVQVYNVKCIPKGSLQQTCYPLSFIETDTFEPNRSPFLSEQLKSLNNKIHFFCFDCSRSCADQRKQADLFCQLLDQLKNSLNTSIGIYLIVTKTDTMLHVPAEFRYDAAQTLITATHRQLWQKVVITSYKMNIYDATPIPFSVGDVVLKDIVRPNLTDASNLLHYPIFLKSYRQPNFFKKILWTGGWKKTAVTLILFGGFILYALYAAFSIIPTPPMIKPQPYFFECDFIKRVKIDIPEHRFEKSRLAYDNLRWELIVENNIRLSDGERLNDVSYRCDSCLTNMFAKELIRNYTLLYDESNWFDSSYKLEEFGRYVTILKNNPIVKPTLLTSSEKKLLRFKMYYDNLKDLISLIDLSTACTSWNDVKFINDHYQLYKTYPYNNDKTLSEKLNNLVKNSHVSYAGSLCEKAENYRKNYKKQVKWGIENYESQEYFDDIFSKYLRNTNDLRRDINIAISNSPQEFHEYYQFVTKILNVLKYKLND